mmetsp:Transcript_12928/g.19446  ORF Transcript_12928/g.19446 Transcript_12928/m.19446 type:complete len:376 (+) Transcript_12928:126-1253(+)|eukprot:CAMPEP_0185036402 /NCGR_PEP_ID=MMETSP1103-20130426/29344_1 /TAXON_ID=36769 /ORGANISM="Paraphysomonas bandaiensis, Strain Caron Lab Isolate" /LENGTH=375 /DNA_ID=CAMNT_0027573927 /DNA_START=62 /DNA_END=1189 /DNA_ORIENTATION=-
MKSTSLLPLISIGLIGLAYVLYPYRMSLLYIVTMNPRRIKPGCTPTVPKLNLEHIKSCDEIVPDSEPCVIRNAVPREQLDQFIANVGDNNFNLKRIPSEGRMGNPLMEPHYLGTDNRADCSVNDLINRNPACLDHYTGFKSLNYSHYTVLNNTNLDLNDFSRTDIFIGYPAKPKVTASFHSNSFEKSSTLQLVGEKEWLMMKPTDYFGLFQAFALGAYNAAYSVCVNDLEKITMQTVRTGPGDILRFPKAWPHHIYSLEGPNVMINFRSFDMRPWLPQDFVAVISEIVSAFNSKDIRIRTEFCNPDEATPTNYGQENPKPHFFQRLHKPYDMRCVDIFNSNIVQYKNYAIANSIQSEDIDEGIFNQVHAYLAGNQ